MALHAMIDCDRDDDSKTRTAPIEKGQLGLPPPIQTTDSNDVRDRGLSGFSNSNQSESPSMGMDSVNSLNSLNSKESQSSPSLSMASPLEMARSSKKAKFKR